ncbi:hypothetical protein B0H10DRAFT_2165830 [Mycena sp. CBHHK59/15]|nr:hypothetical protein B0H10DRAFT_2165830 [Mycena sp. CBHHK59/15]
MSQPLRKVHLPLFKFTKCDACSKTKNLRLCAACGERNYCSAECQKKDWPSHKVACDRIDLEAFYPFLACLAESGHVRADMPTHPALAHAIYNSPNPGSHPAQFPDGSAANLILLGDPISLPHEMMSWKWWPTAATDKVRGKMGRRILREGYALPIATAICVALLAEIYTTTAVSAEASSDKKLWRRVRLKYKTSPVSDFGIVTGSADFIRGQDPDDHYWIYFTTIKGEDVLLDCAMFTFNLCLMIHAAPYLCEGMPPLDFAPAFFRERVLDRSTPELHTERKRMSVLRNESLHRAVVRSLDGFHDPDVDAISSFMASLAGRNVADLEVELALKCGMVNCKALATTLETRNWEKWPATPYLAIEADPGELDDIRANPGDEEEDQEWFEYMKKWRSRNKKGASKEALGVAFREWEAKNAATRRAKS